MERTAIFFDIAILGRAFRKLGARVDYLGLRDYLAEGRLLVEAFAYLSVNPHKPEQDKHLANFLQDHGFLVRSKVGRRRPNNKWTCNVGVEMAVDILHYIHHARPDIIVIGSGHRDMLPICDEVRRSGARCEIASTRECMATELFGVASGFIDLGTIIREQCEELIQNRSEDATGIVPEI